MSRFLLLAVLLVCIFYELQANPLPDDNAPGTLDQVTAQAKKMLNDAREYLSNVDLNDAMEKAKTYLNQARDNINADLKNLERNVQN